MSKKHRTQPSTGTWGEKDLSSFTDEECDQKSGLKRHTNGEDDIPLGQPFELVLGMLSDGPLSLSGLFWSCFGC